VSASTSVVVTVSATTISYRSILTDTSCISLNSSIPLSSSTMEVTEAEAASLSYQDFVDNHLRPNLPLLLHNATANWGCSKKWINADGQPGVCALAEEHGDCDVPVKEGGQCSTMKLSDYASRWGNNSNSTAYLKDWHFVQSVGGTNSEEAKAAYTTPVFFGDDWLNEWTDANGFEDDINNSKKDDYRFLYLGPFGSSTLCHHDVLRSCSWSANVAGLKRWILFPPASTPFLFSKSGELVEDARPGMFDATQFPEIEGCEKMDFLQSSGDAVFVPSGWYHCVYNVAEGGTLSINHNWFNGYNLKRVAAFLIDEELPDVQAVVRRDAFTMETDPNDSRAWARQCEVVMKANSGMNVTALARLVMAKAGDELRADKPVIVVLEALLHVAMMLLRDDVLEHVFVDGFEDYREEGLKIEGIRRELASGPEGGR
jgi:hypothetical protein